MVVLTFYWFLISVLLFCIRDWGMHCSSQFCPAILRRRCWDSHKQAGLDLWKRNFRAVKSHLRVSGILHELSSFSQPLKPKRSYFTHLTIRHTVVQDLFFIFWIWSSTKLRPNLEQVEGLWLSCHFPGVNYI